MKEILSFLSALAENNNRDWFNDNKPMYTESLESFRELCEIIISGISGFDPTLIGLDAKSSIFRIYRDVRFSKDKHPYKTHFGCWMTKGGRKSTDAGYYFHLEPGASFIAAGSYQPPGESLKLIREEILYDPESWLKLVNDPVLVKEFSRGMHEDKLVRPPAGFPADFPYLEEIKHKHFIFTKNYNDTVLMAKDFTSRAVDDFRKLHPLVAWLNNALSMKGNV